MAKYQVKSYSASVEINGTCYQVSGLIERQTDSSFRNSLSIPYTPKLNTLQITPEPSEEDRKALLQSLPMPSEKETPRRRPWH